MRTILLASVVLAVGGPIHDAAAAQPVSQGEWERLVESLAEAVREQYVLPDRAGPLADLIESWRPGTEDLTRPELIEALTEDVVRWSEDQHFVLFHPEIPPPVLPSRVIGVMTGDECWSELQEYEAAWVMTDIVRLPAQGRLECGFPQDLGGKSLVVDLRACTGGSRAAVAAFLGRFFRDRVHFATYFRRDKKEGEGVVGREKPDLSDARVIVLVGPETASGCEAVAYHLQQLDRATIVGQRTFGAAHAVRTFDLAGGYRAFVPIIRSESTVTGGNWEGVGVLPDQEIPLDMNLAEVVQAFVSDPLGSRLDT